MRGDGVRAYNEGEIQALYQRTLAQLSALLRQRPYLLGERPSIVDFSFFASMFRHFALDPHSAKIMVDTAPAVYAWVARMWNAAADSESNQRSALDAFSSPDWDAIFSELGRDYLPYLDANAAAYARGARRFDLRLVSARYPQMPVVRYRVACRQQLLLAYQALPSAAQQQVQARLAAHPGVAAWLSTAAMIDAGLAAEFALPLQQGYRPARGFYGLRLFMGTPWDLPSAPLPPHS